MDYDMMMEVMEDWESHQQNRHGMWQWLSLAVKVYDKVHHMQHAA
jgi:hypothetical protein